MARLNEPSTQVEVNSTQSLRIRSLESEISRLLSENISLREQVIRLQFEIEHNVGADSINTVRGRLETKLGELGSLVQELGNLQQDAEDQRAIRRRSGVKASPKKSPDQRNWKNGLTISEATGGADGRLPPIVEGKYYPRRTLDAEELLGTLQDSGDPADSPDLGPPPIAHFEAGDPIRFETTHHGSPRKERSESGVVLNPALLANLETRRKRRESSRQGENGGSETKDLCTIQQEQVGGTSRPEHTLKSGAKRKLSAREDEQPEEHSASERVVDFKPNHALEHHAERSEPVIMQPAKQAEQETEHEMVKITARSRGRPKINANPSTSSRNVLAPKSVNTDPATSPVKANRLAPGDKAGPLKPDRISKQRDSSKARDQPASQRFARPAKPHQAEVPERKIKTTFEGQPPSSRPPAETSAPVPLDICSPDDYEPPTARPESRDTPPPVDLDPEMANTNAFGSLGRASRRQKGSVSYAEPNLRDKMRRPTKELVDAVMAEERMQQRRASKDEADATEAEPIVTGEAPSKMRTVTIKKEPTADEGLDWRALPVRKSGENGNGTRAEVSDSHDDKLPTVKADLPSSVVTERRRRPSMFERDKAMGEGRQQGASAAPTMAALMTDNPKHRSREIGAQMDKSKQASRPSERPEMYDIQGSSPAESDDPTAKARELKPTVSRSSRRHSSVSDDRIKEAMARRVERNKETAAVPDLKSVRSAATLAVGTGDGAQGRGERAASRRRSMLL
ncbi:MAG: hypothetical protein L6R35_000091 [Caloplaca aegaea]|nr:MAG: hypothetical protein L6R35_000091 [Caloplaca aegaea]